MSDSVRPHRRQPTRLPSPWDSPGKNTGEGCHFLLQRMKVKSESEVAQSCPTLSDPIDRSLPGSSVHGIFQARVLEWGAIAFSGAPNYLMPEWSRLTVSCRAQASLGFGGTCEGAKQDPHLPPYTHTHTHTHARTHTHTHLVSGKIKEIPG